MAQRTPKKTQKKSSTKPAIMHRLQAPFQHRKKTPYIGAKLSSGIDIIKQSLGLIWEHKVSFGGVLLVYGILQIILVQGVLANNFSELRNIFEDSFGGVAGSFATLSYMVSNIGQVTSPEAGVYQSILLLIGSLAIIWAVRQLSAGKDIRIRDAYYKGMYPLVPYTLVTLVIALQLLPAIIGAWLFGVVVANGIAVSMLEQGLWLAVFFVFASASIYMLCSSLFALFIVSLPDMTPMRALRSARGIVRYRRISIVGRMVILLLFVAVTYIAVMVPVIMFVAVLAPIVFYVTTVMITGLSITYMYIIYRELIKEDD